MEENDDGSTCPICTEAFDHDPNAFSDKTTSHLPVQLSKCPHVICYSCVIREKFAQAELKGKDASSVKWLKCRLGCGASTCFNTENPILCLTLCNMLRRQRRRAEACGTGKRASSTEANGRSCRTRIESTGASSSEEGASMIADHVQTSSVEPADEAIAALDSAKQRFLKAISKDRAARKFVAQCDTSVRRAKEHVCAIKGVLDQVKDDLTQRKQARKDAAAERESTSEEVSAANELLCKMKRETTVVTYAHARKTYSTFRRHILVDYDCDGVAFATIGYEKFALFSECNRKCEIWDISSGQRTLKISELDGMWGDSDAWASLHNDYLISGTINNGAIAMWDAVTGERVCKYEGPDSCVTSIAVLDNDKFMCGYRDNTLKLWSLSSEQCIRTYDHQENREHNLDDATNFIVAIGEHYFLNMTESNRTNVWHISNGDIVRTYKSRLRRHVAVVDDESFLLTSSTGEYIKLWSLSSKERLCKYRTTSKCISAIALVGKQHFVCGDSRGTIMLWSLSRHKYICIQAQACEGWVSSILALGDNRFISSSEDDDKKRTIKVWELS